MSQQHPVTPPPELVASLRNSAPHGIRDAGVTREIWLINHAYAAGADQELEACVDVLGGQWEWDVLSQCTGWKEFRDQSEEILRASRRPKPPSLKEQALEAQQRMWDGTSNHDDWNLIRRALEALPND